MKIEFKREGNDYITSNGLKLDDDLIGYYDHDFLADGSGWVELPNAVITNLEGDVRLIGINITKQPIMDNQGNIINTQPHIQLPNPEITHIFPPNSCVPSTSKTINYPPIGVRDPTKTLKIKDLEPFIGDKFPEDHSLKQHLRDAYTKGFQKLTIEPNNIPKELVEYPIDEEDKIFSGPAGISPKSIDANIQSLLSLGFHERGSARWFHPIFGDDKEWNWLLFDPRTDNLISLVPKIFRTGRVQGIKKVRMDIKAALDI